MIDIRGFHPLTDFVLTPSYTTYTRGQKGTNRD
jgi:hypothetical protein